MIIAVSCIACSTPAQRYNKQAATLGLTMQVVQTDHFAHAVFDNGVVAGERLFILIEGDGTPWVGNIPAADPTPRRPLMTALAAKMSAPAYVLGRPCYHAIDPIARCQNDHWTYARYSEQVVASLAQVVGSLSQAWESAELVLVGHSGGGTLAYLVAAQLSNVDAIITLAANLDVPAWTRYHGYEALVDSMNPTTAPKPPAAVTQIHYIGANDSVVPPHTRAAFFAAHPQAKEVLLQDFGHYCCWLEAWPELLNRALVSESAATQRR